MTTLFERIAEAKRETRRLKGVTPYIFPEWQRLKVAERDYDSARREVEAARSAWKKLGAA
jgi:hypothetical protein